MINQEYQYVAREWFEIAIRKMKGIKLDRQDGTKTEADVEKEFMFMGVSDYGYGMFKHIHTRNYLYIHKSGNVIIPKKDQAFNRGVF